MILQIWVGIQQQNCNLGVGTEIGHAGISNERGRLDFSCNMGRFRVEEQSIVEQFKQLKYSAGLHLAYELSAAPKNGVDRVVVPAYIMIHASTKRSHPACT